MDWYADRPGSRGHMVIIEVESRDATSRHPELTGTVHRRRTR
jgi:hypothetical protein